MKRYRDVFFAKAGYENGVREAQTIVEDSVRGDSSIICVLMVRLGVNKSCLCELRVVTIEKDGRWCRLRVGNEMRAEMSRFPDCAHQAPKSPPSGGKCRQLTIICLVCLACFACRTPADAAHAPCEASRLTYNTKCYYSTCISKLL